MQSRGVWLAKEGGAGSDTQTQSTKYKCHQNQSSWNTMAQLGPEFLHFLKMQMVALSVPLNLLQSTGWHLFVPGFQFLSNSPQGQLAFNYEESLGFLPLLLHQRCGSLLRMLL